VTYTEAYCEDEWVKFDEIKISLIFNKRFLICLKTIGHVCRCIYGRQKLITL